MMRGVIRAWIVCAGVAWAGVALAQPKAPAPAAPKAAPAAAPKAPKAAPKVNPRVEHKAAAAAHVNGDYQKALEHIDRGLAVAPKDRNLRRLKGTVLLEQRDYPGALEAYEAYLDVVPGGQNKRHAQNIVNKLRAVKSTFLEITLANGPADVYLDSKTLGRFCRAEPSCNQPVLPNPYTVIVERPGFKRWTGPITVASGQTAKLSVTLEEKPSQLTLRVTPPEASITVDDAPYDPSKPIAAGDHDVVVSLAGHKEERFKIKASEGNPVEREVALLPIVPIRIEPATAELQLDGKPVQLQDGGLALPPGAHKLVARAPDFEDRELEVPADRPAGYELVVQLDRKVVPPPPPPPPPIFTTQRKIALAAGGAGVLAVGAGVLLGMQSGKLEDDAYALCASPSEPCVDAPAANDHISRAQSRALQANIAFGVAGGAAIAAAVLWFTGAHRTPEARVDVTPRLGAGTAGLDLAVRF